MHKIWSLAAAASFGAVRVRGPRQGRTMYLTFDDGPHPQYTPELLALLEAHGALGTFFTVGRDAMRHPGLLQRILQGGHTLGNHSMTHAQLPRLAPPAQLEEIHAADRVLAAVSGQPRHVFRPPHGRATPTVLAYSVFRRHPMALWTLDSLDYKLPAEAVVKRLSEHPLSDGEMLLFHDDGASGLNALRTLLPLWKAQGWRFAAL